MLDIRKEPHGISFAVRVTPRSSRNLVAGEEGGVLKIRLNAPPVDGKANDALIRFMAKQLGLARRDVNLAKGEKSRNKRLCVSGISADELHERLGL